MRIPEPVRILVGRVRCHLLIRGRVQGVGFRYYAAHQARLLALGGFIRNLPDGRVEGEVEGSKEAVEAFIDRVRRGSAGSVVADVDVRVIDPLGEEAFRIG